MKPDISRQPTAITIATVIVLLAVFGRNIYGGAEMTALSSGHVLSDPVLMEGIVLTGSSISPDMPLQHLMRGWLTGHHLLITIVWALLAAVNGFLIIRFSSRNMLATVRNHLPMVFYIVLACSLPQSAEMIFPLAASFLIIKGCEYYAASFVRAYAFGSMFTGSFILGTAPLIYGPSVIYFLLMPIAGIIFKRSGREILVGLIGLVLPIVICAYVLWAVGQPFPEVFSRLSAILTARNSYGFTLDPMWTASAVPALLIMITAVISAGLYFRFGSDMRTRAYKIYGFSIYFLIIGCAGATLPCASFEELPLLAIPAALLSNVFFGRIKGYLPVIIYCLTIIAAIGINIFLSVY